MDISKEVAKGRLCNVKLAIQELADSITIKRKINFDYENKKKNL